MPIYSYKCDKCNIEIDLQRKIDDRDKLESVKIDNCPHSRHEFGTDGKTCIWYFITPDKECQLKRIPTKASFKI